MIHGGILAHLLALIGLATWRSTHGLTLAELGGRVDVEAHDAVVPLCTVVTVAARLASNVAQAPTQGDRW